MHINNKLLNEQKFMYLLGYLKSRPKDLLEGVYINEQNYEISIKILKDEYGDKNNLIKLHCEKLRNINKCMMKNNIKEHIF